MLERHIHCSDYVYTSLRRCRDDRVVGDDRDRPVRNERPSQIDERNSRWGR